MALLNTLTFLPSPFRSITNQRFLGATMDQLTSDAVNVPINGYIGRTFAPTYKLGDNYVPEPTTDRANYQLEPSVVITDSNNDIVLNSGYVDLLQGIRNYGGVTDNHQRLFSSTIYNYDGQFDYDKFVNYHNYYWLANGPDSVTVSSLSAPLLGDFTVYRNTGVNGYTFSGQGGHPNQQLTLVRGGTYTFNISQPGAKFWIQKLPGTSGMDPDVASLSVRDVYGVTNNGVDNGSILFNVPSESAQDFYIAMPIRATVSAAVTFNYTDIQNTLVSKFLENFPEGLDGITNQLQNKTIVFINNSVNDNDWESKGLFDDPSFDSLGEYFDTLNSQRGIVPESLRQYVWRLNIVTSASGEPKIVLTPVTAVARHEKVFVGGGQTYASKEFWLTNNQQYQQVPLITANADYLYYQDDQNPDFVGQIKIIDNESTPIDITNDILGRVGYTSPNGVIFTNGLKIQFDSAVTPSTYANREFYVEGVGTGIMLAPVDQLIVPEAFGANMATTPDYITINRGSQDRNPWSRSNRWFHKDVLEAAATYNNTQVDYGSNIYGRRAIIEFNADLQLFNYGKQAKNAIDIITFDETDAFVDIEGQISCTLEGVELTDGMRLIFANDYDTLIGNKVWRVEFEIINSQRFLRLVETTDDPILPGEQVTVTQGTFTGNTYYYDGTGWNLCQAKTTVNQAPLFDIVDADGYSFGDTTVYPGTTFTGSKLFGYPVVAGTNDSILGFPLKYQNFNNIGDIVFQNYYDTDSFTYTSGISTTASVDINSGYMLKNTGLSTSTQLINWIPSDEPSEQYQIITKFFEGYLLDVDGVQKAFIQIDILPDVEALSHSDTDEDLEVYLNNQRLSPLTDYQVIKYGLYDVITFTNIPALGDKIDVKIASNVSVSKLGYYEIPVNLDYNSLNKDFTSITLGQMRTHYNKLINITPIVAGDTIPFQDRYIKNQGDGGTLLQHKSPLVYAMTFLTDPTVNYINGITLARSEYTRFKNKFLSLCESMRTLDYSDPVGGVDAILLNINSVKNSSFPWYYSDMVPQGGTHTEIVYTVLNARQTDYEISSIFDITQLSNRAVLVYWTHNGITRQLLGSGLEYSYNPLTPEIIINSDTISLTVGDTITIRDYSDTDGCFVPETPAKLGLITATPPAKYLDTTYQTPINVIRGHDGSIMPAFNDFRDDYLLELEKRIYNNIKTDYTTLNVMNLFDTVPGRFRTTGYSLDEWNQLLTKNFLQFVGSNNIDYTTNSWYNANSPWSWNYNEFRDSVDGSYLQGSWRAIYKYWFDTDQPHLAPWEMLGFFSEPSWWATRYGTAPYTRNNTVLWEDLEQGYVWNGSNAAAYTDTRFVRPGLSGTLTNTFGFIPVDDAGNLIDPTRTGIVGEFNTSGASNSFEVGEQGPVETAWRRSSDFAYAVQQALALSRPAEYFSTQIDLSRFYKNAVTGYFTDVNNRKIKPSLLTVNGETLTNGTIERTAGYLNWIADYVKNLGMDPVTKIESYFGNFNVQLAYRCAGFTDQNLITVSAEQTTPGSTNASVIIPDESYKVHLHKSLPVQTISYSAVVVTRTDAGYSVSGYNTSHPYFTILPSIANNKAVTITVQDLSVKLYQSSEPTPVELPYGTTFSTPQQVADFLVSYQRYLESQGFVFAQFDRDLEAQRTWQLSVEEFLYWAQQGWRSGVLIVLNPVKDTLDIKTTGTIVDEITNSPNGSRLIDINYSPIKSDNFNLVRIDKPESNQFQVATVNNQTTIAFAQLNLVQYETALVFDNVDSFGDIIYVPEQGTRQYRLKMNGAKTGLWNGSISATGYIYSDPVINDWQPGTDYKQGDIIKFNNSYYTAPADVVASQTFNITKWTLISINDIQTGLLPSFGHNAQVFENIYDVNNPPQDENYQIFSAGLIGYRERPFLSNLGITIPTQTKFYQGYIKQKGTRNAIKGLINTQFNTISSNINLYEEWAFEVGKYGDTDHNQFVEFVLDQSVFSTNPVAFTSNSAHSTGNIIVNLNGNAASHFESNLVSNSDVYNSSNVLSTITTVYNNRPAGQQYETDLPTAGYVNLADVDYTIFDISTISKMPTLAAAKKIWVAKDFNKSWNVYRVNDTGLVASNLKYTLDSFGQLTFTTSHSFSVGDRFVLQGFDSVYDGLYQVKSIPSATSVTIILPVTTPIISKSGKIDSIGSVFTLDSLVINTYSQIGTVIFAGGPVTNDRVWVNNVAGGWAVYTYNGSTWVQTRSQQAAVDITSINRTFVYNKTNDVILAVVDYIDPLKGKVLSAVGVDIDYQLTTDPALYNVGNLILQPTLTIHSDLHWGPAQVGKIWWDLDSIRYVDYEQDALIYRLNHWGEQFPGSSISVYEWVESLVLPSEYAATYNDGIPLFADDSAYSTYGYVDQGGVVRVKYYFWVSGKTTVNTDAGKTNSVYSIAAAIKNPQAQGIPYATVLRDDTIALYNINSVITGTNSVLHLGSRSNSAGVVHTEYALVQEGNPQSQPPQSIINKLIDSLVGKDVYGNPVPDTNLPESQQYGIQIRPRQSMFKHRVADEINPAPGALENFLEKANAYLEVYPVVERKVLTTLNSEEPIPTPDSGAYSQTVSSYAELLYVNTDVLAAGYQILVTADETQSGKWAIYTLSFPSLVPTWAINPTKTRLIGYDAQNNPEYGYWVQSYKTNLYWNTIDWYEIDYDYTVAPEITVDNRLELGKLTLTAGTHIKVLDNGVGQFEVYHVNNDLSLTLIGLQNGTIQISTSTIPPTELRQILVGLSTEVFIDDLATEYNQIFFTLIKYALAEQQNIDWAFKTSFISATQYIRALIQFPSYIADNQGYYQEYINEVKPYRTTVREFVVDYQGDDLFDGDITDFDLPPYYDANVGYYRSPNGEQVYDAATLSSGVYRPWSANYKYKLVDVIIEDPGTGYLFTPSVAITGGGGTGAEGYATINSLGQVTDIIITNPGTGYTSTPNITINGTGIGARATAVIRSVFDGNNTGHNLVRSIETKIKFDRVGYTTANTFVFWDTLTANANIGNVIPADTIIVLNSLLYKLANSYTITGNTITNLVDFPTANVTQVYAGDFDNANDRIVAFNGNVDLRLTQTGLEYPGVIVDGNAFTGNIYDSVIQSRYTDSVGVNPSDIIIDGGQYVDRFSSYAPEEFVPGRMYDSVDIIVRDTDHLGFRIFEDMNQGYNSYRITTANSTTLSANLNLTDTSILVTNAAALPAPNLTYNIPGVVFVNGEKITYWRNYALETQIPWAANTVISKYSLISYSGNTYLTTGNVFGAYFSNVTSNVQSVSINTLAQIRRAVDSTCPQLVHTAGSTVYDSGINQLIPGSANSNVTVSTSTTYQATAESSVSYKVELTDFVSGNIGDAISQVQTVDDWKANTDPALGSLVYYSGNSYTVTGNVYAANFASITSNVTLAFAGNTKTISTMRMLETASNVNNIAVLLVSGAIKGLPVVFDGADENGQPGSYDHDGFDATTGTIFINGTNTNVYAITSQVLGTVSNIGQVTIGAGNILMQSNVWYSPGVGTGTITNGLPLVNSTTPQATFLKASLWI